MGKREWTSLALAVLVAACAGDAADDAEPAADTMPAVQQPTQPGATGGGTLPEGVTQAMVDEGKTVFETNGNCHTCHGMDGSGTALAPNLRDQDWLNTDGTLAGIEGVVRTGVAQPKQFPAPMPAMGGGTLSDDQVRAVASYVFSISHGG